MKKHSTHDCALVLFYGGCARDLSMLDKKTSFLWQLNELERGQTV